MIKSEKARVELVAQLARKQFQTQKAWHRRLHQNPELSFEEHATTRFLRNEIRKLGLKILPLSMNTGVLAELRGKKPGPTVAVRSDIDALPIREQTDLPFKSKNTGTMHACGHDIHMATVLGTAAVLNGVRDRLAGTVRFIFQPGEERPPGGARPMIENGALEGVSAIFGLHVDPHLSVGKISLRDGVTMASVFDFDLIIRGTGGHAARPHTAVDAIATAAEVVDSLQKVVTREIDPIAPVVITFGRIEGGTARNVIADEVHLVGTARTLSDKLYRRIPAKIKRTVAGVCRARGAKFELKPIASYPVLKNTSRINKLFASNYRELFGSGKVEETEPVLGGEDFACYLQQVPGAMFRLGVRNRKLKADQPWHSSRFMADEKAIFYGTALLALSALEFSDMIG